MGSWNDALYNLREGKATFGDAIEALKKGNKVSTSNWNNSETYLYYVAGCNIILKKSNDEDEFHEYYPTQKDVLAGNWMIIE